MEQSVPLLDRYGSEDGLFGPDREIGLEKTPEPRRSRLGSITTYLFLAGPYLLAALPRFLRPGGLKRAKKPGRTAYLDALRGYAACIVFAMHTIGGPGPILNHPFLRFLLQGHGMVTIFFVISGYALSFRMLTLMRTRETAQLLNSLASSAFRRYLRLYIPTMLATFLTSLAIYAGWTHPEFRKESLSLQLWDWLKDSIRTIDPFHHVEGWWYEGVFCAKTLPQMWTIPVEFRGSMILFLFCAAVCKMSTRARMITTWICIFCSFWWQAVYVGLFLSGMFVADWSMSSERTVRLPQSQEPGVAPERRQRLLAVGSKVGSIVAFLIGIFLLSQPQYLAEDAWWPWATLWRLPAWYMDNEGYREREVFFWLAVGSFFLVLGLEFSPMLQTPLRWNFSLYLGELSFGIYAMHNTVQWILYQERLEPYRQQHMGDSAWGYVPEFVITAVAVLWAADYFTRFDSQVVIFGKWLQGKTFLNW